MFLLKSEKRTSAELLNILGSVDISFEPDNWTDRQDSQDRQRNDDRYDNNRSNWY